MLSGDKFTLEMRLRQPEFAYSFCGPFTKNKKKNIKIWRNRRFGIYLSKQTRQYLILAWYGSSDFKDLPRITASDKVLHDKAFKTAKYPKYDGYQHELASMV